MEYGPWQTCSTRFYRWVKAGVGTECWPNSSGRQTGMGIWTGACTAERRVDDPVFGRSMWLEIRAAVARGFGGTCVGEAFAP